MAHIQVTPTDRPYTYKKALPEMHEKIRAATQRSQQIQQCAFPHPGPPILTSMDLFETRDGEAHEKGRFGSDAPTQLTPTGPSRYAQKPQITTQQLLQSAATRLA